MKEQDKMQNKTKVARRDFLRVLGAGAAMLSLAPGSALAQRDNETVLKS